MRASIDFKTQAMRNLYIALDHINVYVDRIEDHWKTRGTVIAIVKNYKNRYTLKISVTNSDTVNAEIEDNNPIAMRRIILCSENDPKLLAERIEENIAEHENPLCFVK